MTQPEIPTGVPAQPAAAAAAEKKWWWKVALHLDEAKLAAVNAMALNVDDPRPVLALQEVIGQAQAILLDIFIGKNLLPAAAIAPPSEAPPPEAPPPYAPPDAPPVEEAAQDVESAPSEQPATVTPEQSATVTSEQSATVTPPNGVPVQDLTLPNGQSEEPVAQ